MSLCGTPTMHRSNINPWIPNGLYETYAEVMLDMSGHCRKTNRQ